MRGRREEGRNGVSGIERDNEGRRKGIEREKGERKRKGRKRVKMNGTERFATNKYN